ncbi:MAG: GTPase HflX [Lachnospiraceae bacterium]|nr:GTPase HflX [Lachnospiraceae bacterium]
MQETAKIKEKFILAGIGTDEEEVSISLDELGELVKTAGGEGILKVIQIRENRHPQTYMGTGKIEEISQQVSLMEADGVVFDDELSASQMSRIEEMLGCKVMDRTMVILDIFAAHALSAEGSIQVELAQLQYRATHLIGMGKVLSRLGGGIGTRGPGEKKLEIDRRRIHERISQLKRELKEVEKHRGVTRARRSRNGEFCVSIVGYTNAGKSTLLNTLTGAGILAEDMLFATLDPTTREYKMRDGEKMLLTDTVGFIRKLPHNLIDAFKSTLEEAVHADLILHVVDAADPDRDAHMDTVYRTLSELGIQGKPVITVFNKADLLTDQLILWDPRADRSVRISAKEGTGIEKLEDAIARFMHEGMVYIEKIFAFSDASIISRMHESGNIVEEYREDGIFVKGYVKKELGTMFL